MSSGRGSQGESLFEAPTGSHGGSEGLLGWAGAGCNDVGGALTEEEFWSSVEGAALASRIPTPDMMVVAPSTMRRGRRAAFGFECQVGHCERELLGLARRRWLRRRFLRRRIGWLCQQAESLRSTFGYEGR